MSMEDEMSTAHSLSREEDSAPVESAKNCEGGTREGEGPKPCVIVDAGRDAWMTVGGIWLVQFCTYGYISAFGVYQDFYTREFLRNATPSSVSWIGSVQLFLQYAPGVVVGAAFDAGYFHHMAIVGSALQTFSMFMLSLVYEGQYYQVFLAQALGMGLGQSLLFLPSIIVIGHHFKRRRALATGIALSGAPIGGLIWPIVVNQLFTQNSFTFGVRVSAAITGFLLISANVMMKSRQIPRQHLSPNPVFPAIFADTAYLISVGAAFLAGLGIFFPYFYLQLYAINQGIDEHFAFYAVAIINAGGFFGRILPTLFTDTLGVYNILILCLVLLSGLIFGIFGIHTSVGVGVFGCLYGFLSGSCWFSGHLPTMFKKTDIPRTLDVSLIPSLLAQLSPRVAEQGTRMGVAFSTVSFAMLAGPPIHGALVRAENEKYAWHRALVFCGVMMQCGALGMILSRYLFIKQGRGGERGSRV